MAGIVVNGEQRPLEGVPLHTNALDFLRACGLTGAKEGCAEGECGACAVMVARPAADGSEATEWTAINSCLVPAATLDGQEVVTAEGLGAPEALHPVQQEMAVRGGSQCGYCTPGFVCSMAAEFYRAGRKATNGSTPEPHDGYHGDNGFDLHALSGNLCRCTGYRPIKDAAYALGFPGARRRARRTPYGGPAGRRTHPAARRRGVVHQADRSPTGTEDSRRGARRPPSSPAAPTGASTSTSRERGRGWSWRLTDSKSCGVSRRLLARPPQPASGRDPDRRGADPQRDRASARRQAAAAGRAVPAVRVAADPQRRHARWQPRHRLAHRRRAPGAAGS